MLGIFLIDYKRTDPLRDCETIESIEKMTRARRLTTALLLSCACVDHTGSPEALNLIGRILREAAEDSGLYNELIPAVRENLEGHTFDPVNLTITGTDTPEDWLEASDLFLDKAVEYGYVYACNNKAARLAELIVNSVGEGSSIEELRETVDEYAALLKSSADKYEPYAANRLGLLYMTGEIHDSEGGFAVSRDHIDRSRAKEYFLKATKYPDSNSAWAFYNLIKYFHRDYDSNIELMNEHMDCIKKLNPRVYDLAIEL
jgi:TPR repeat protein